MLEVLTASAAVLRGGISLEIIKEKRDSESEVLAGSY